MQSSKSKPIPTPREQAGENGSTIKVRKALKIQPPRETGNFKTPPQLKPKTSSNRLGALHKPKGCRCGRATTTPGQLTCCGQRCPCYVRKKSCTNCFCKGCRNTYCQGGYKVQPMIPMAQTTPSTTTDIPAAQDCPGLQDCDNTPLQVFSYILMDSPSDNVATTPVVESSDSFQVIGFESLPLYDLSYENIWHHYEPY